MTGHLRLTVRKVGISAALDGVARLHRHLPKCAGGLVAFEVVNEAGWPVGWAIVGRPSSRHLQAQGWAEVVRVATDGSRNACSALYGACSRWAKGKHVGLITYTLELEPGTSLRAAGWRHAGWTRGGQWACPSRPRAVRAGAVAGRKQRWVAPWSVKTKKEEA